MGRTVHEEPQTDEDKMRVERFDVPADFPRSTEQGAVPGAQPKFLATRYEGKFYVAESTPPELYARWEVCEDLASQIRERSLASKVGKRSHMTEVEILDQYLPRLIEMRWTSVPEARWIIRRVSQMLGWAVPLAAQEKETIQP